VQKVLSITLVLLLPNFCSGKSFEEHITEFYPGLVSKIEECGFCGPIAEELAQYALIRQVHEDGVERSPSHSVPGISTGGWNEDILQRVLQKLRLSVVLTKCHDSEGTSLFVIRGANANLLSATTIACLYDYYLTQFKGSFSDAQRLAWLRSKYYSWLIYRNPGVTDYLDKYTQFAEERNKIIKRCNRMYGPGADRIEFTVQRLQPKFKGEPKRWYQNSETK